jgi:glutaminase
MDLQQIIADIADEIEADAKEIEASADAKDETQHPGPFGIALAGRDGVLSAGTADTRFPIQSISKVLALNLALRERGNHVFERVGREPSGDPFNSLIDLERTHGIPRNPFINAGALVVVDMLVAEQPDGDAVVDFVRELVEGHPVSFNDDVLHEGGDLNRAMLSFMKHHGNLDAPLDRVMDAYAKQCAISVDCKGLALIGNFLSRTARADNDVVATSEAQRHRTVLALMMTCGHYGWLGRFCRSRRAPGEEWRWRRNPSHSARTRIYSSLVA